MGGTLEGGGGLAGGWETGVGMSGGGKDGWDAWPPLVGGVTGGLVWWVIKGFWEAGGWGVGRCCLGGNTGGLVESLRTLSGEDLPPLAGAGEVLGGGGLGGGCPVVVVGEVLSTRGGGRATVRDAGAWPVAADDRGPTTPVNQHAPINTYVYAITS